MKNHLDILLVSGSMARRRSLAKLLHEQFPAAALRALSGMAWSRAALEQGPADILIVDVDSPGAAAAMVHALEDSSGKLGAVALIDDPSPRWMQTALQAGVNAFISRAPDAEELELAIEAASAGLILLHPSSARSLAVRNPPPALTYAMEQLTARETQVLRLIGDGLGNKEIAARLNISEHTAKFHTSSILGKLGVASRAEAVSEGIKRGLIPI